MKKREQYTDSCKTTSLSADVKFGKMGDKVIIKTVCLCNMNFLPLLSFSQTALFHFSVITVLLLDRI